VDTRPGRLQAIKVYHGGGSKTLDEMFDSQHQGIAGRTLAALARIGRSVAPSLTHGKLVRTESMETRECSEIGLAWAGAICEQNGQEFAGKLFDMGTFEITEASSVPIGTKVMDTVFSFKRKEDSEGRLKELSCRIKTDGRQQEKGSCGDTIAPTSKFSCVRTICALAAQEGLTLYQFDIKGAFLMSPCKEDIYLNLPGRYRLPKGRVLKLKKYIYGLRQSAFHWHQLFAKWLANYGFENIDSDGVTWVKNGTKECGSSNKLLLTVHVDDGLAACALRYPA
jgi:hypothetical protein